MCIHSQSVGLPYVVRLTGCALRVSQVVNAGGERLKARGVVLLVRTG